MREGVGSLDSLRVLELCTEIGGPYAGKLFSDLGADVVKVERVGGDPLRDWPAGGEDAPKGRLFAYLNAGKRGVTLPVQALEEASIVDRLVAWADIVLLDESFSEFRSVGAEGRPQAIVRMTPFGEDGPYSGRPATGLTIQAAASWVSRRGQVDLDPVQVGGRAHEYVVGIYAATSALTAWRWARVKGESMRVELSEMEAVFNTTAYPMLRRETLINLGYTQTRYTAYIPGIMRCRDGWIGVNCLTGQHWQDLCVVLGLPEYADRYAYMRYDGSEMAAFYDRIQPWFDERDAMSILETLQAFRVPAAPVGDGERVLEFSQFRDRGFYRTTPAGEFPVPGPPFRFSATPARVRRAAPSIGRRDLPAETLA